MITNSHIVSSIDYYNGVASCYNSQQTQSDNKVRARVSNIFRNHVPKGNVLDFGGGTGLDLGWLINSGYYIFFLEPSVNMRSLAKQRQFTEEANVHLSFMEEKTNVLWWSSENLPFEEKMDGVLLNFAVLNSINDLDLFFEKIRMVCKPGCYLIMTVIGGHKGIILKKYGISHFMRYIFKGNLVTYIHFNGLIHETFIHSLRRIRKSSRRYFHFLSCVPVASSGFDIITLSAK